MVDYAKLKENAPAVLRIGISLVFLWFSASQFIDVQRWAGYLPGFVANFPYAETFIYINASFELVFGIMLLLGIFTRLSAFLLALHLLSISINLGYTAVAIRDYGLTIATFAIFMNGPDRLCISKN